MFLGQFLLKRYENFVPYSDAGTLVLSVITYSTCFDSIPFAISAASTRKLTSSFSQFLTAMIDFFSKKGKLLSPLNVGIFNGFKNRCRSS